MAGHVRYTALLAACVLYPTTIADALVSLAVTGLFAAKWTLSIEDEWLRNVLSSDPSSRASWRGDAISCEPLCLIGKLQRLNMRP